MSDNAGAAGPEPGNRVAIGITFGNTNSSIAFTVDDKAEVIANEDGGRFRVFRWLFSGLCRRMWNKSKYSELTILFLPLDRQIPTVLSYVDGDEYYGGQAKAFLVRNPDNTIANFRDFLGQEYAHICRCDEPRLTDDGTGSSPSTLPTTTLPLAPRRSTAPSLSP